jgi:hypothetical protein
MITDMKENLHYSNIENAAALHRVLHLLQLQIYTNKDQDATSKMIDQLTIKRLSSLRDSYLTNSIAGLGTTDSLDDLVKETKVDSTNRE